MFDVSLMIFSELESIVGREIPLQLLNDSKFLLDIISKSIRNPEKRLILYVAVAREGYQTSVLSEAHKISLIELLKKLANLHSAISCRLQSSRLILSSGSSGDNEPPLATLLPQFTFLSLFSSSRSLIITFSLICFYLNVFSPAVIYSEPLWISNCGSFHYRKV